MKKKKCAQIKQIKFFAINISHIASIWPERNQITAMNVALCIRHGDPCSQPGFVVIVRIIEEIESHSNAYTHSIYRSPCFLQLGICNG